MTMERDGPLGAIPDIRAYLPSYQMRYSAPTRSSETRQRSIRQLRDIHGASQVVAVSVPSFSEQLGFPATWPSSLRKMSSPARRPARYDSTSRVASRRSRAYSRNRAWPITAHWPIAAEYRSCTRWCGSCRRISTGKPKSRPALAMRFEFAGRLIVAHAVNLVVVSPE